MPIELFGADDRDVHVKLGMSGEGESWESRTRFVLSADGDQLFAEALPQVGEDYFKTIWFYHRCPADTRMGYSPE
ncbi:MAG: hypothetical protein ABR601_00380 [Parasphingopyxis sp.]|nr:hypothetical protein [Sphingomonadales bacterium]